MLNPYKELEAKGAEIIDMVQKIGELIPEDSDILLATKGQMFADAVTLVAKVRGAEAGNLYNIRMESATIIRKAANDLMISNHTLEAFGFQHVEYFTVVRELIEEYRLIFIRWVESFDKWDYVIDRWGLFNPPGISPFDKDPDEDIPFQNPFIE